MSHQHKQSTKKLKTMKKLLTLTVLAFSTMLAVNAQPGNDEKQEKTIAKEDRKALRKMESAEVSNASRNAFAVDFGITDGVTWQRSANFDKATFVKDGVSQTAYYDDDAELVGTVTNKTLNDLPASAQATIAKTFAGYKVNQVIKFTDNENNDTDMMLWDTIFDDQDTYFVELTNGKKTIVEQVLMDGEIRFFKTL